MWPALNAEQVDAAGRAQDGGVANYAEVRARLARSLPEKANEIGDFIKRQCKNADECDRVVNVTDISNAMNKLKADKSDGQSDLISSHLLMCIV